MISVSQALDELFNLVSPLDIEHVALRDANRSRSGANVSMQHAPNLPLRRRRWMATPLNGR